MIYKKAEVFGDENIKKEIMSAEDVCKIRLSACKSEIIIILSGTEYNRSSFMMDCTQNAARMKTMAKQRIKRPGRTHPVPHNKQAAVPEIQGKPKCGKETAKPIIAGTAALSQKVYYTTPYSQEKPITTADKIIYTDLDSGNPENDIPEADLQDLEKTFLKYPRLSFRVFLHSM